MGKIYTILANKADSDSHEFLSEVFHSYCAVCLLFGVAHGSREVKIGKLILKIGKSGKTKKLSINTILN